MNVERLEAAIWEDPDDWTKFVALARLHAQAGRRQRALMYLREVGHRVPRGADAHATIGEVYVALGEAARAEPHLKLAIAIAPKQASTRLLFARSLLAHARFGEAEVALRLAAKLGATATEVRRAIAGGLDRTEDPESARRRLEARQGEGDDEAAIASLLSMLETDVEPRAAQPDFASDLEWLRVSEALELFFARRSTGRLLVVDAARRGEVQLLEGSVIDLRIAGRASLVDHLIHRYALEDGLAAAVSVDVLEARLLQSGQVDRTDLTEVVEGWCARGLAELMTWPQGRLTFEPQPPGDAVDVIQLDTRRLVLAATSVAPNP